MEDPYKESIPVELANMQSEISSTDGTGGDAITKFEDESNLVIPTEAWNVNSPTLTKRSLSPMLGVPGPPVLTQTTDSSAGVALKMATTVLQPICLGESPMVLPILAGASGPQVAPTGTTPYLVTAQGPVSLPLVLEQQLFQHLTPQVLQQAAACPSLSLPNNILCQNPSIALPPSSPVDQKGGTPIMDQSLLTLLQNPNFAAILQDLFPSQVNASPGCHPAGSPRPDPFATGFFPPPPPLTHPYSSPLAPLVPPATLLVPYPIVVPLPVPLPLPIPIPIPVPQTEDSKVPAEPPKPVCTVSQGTQTSARDFPVRMLSPSEETNSSLQPSPSPSCLSASDGEVLDLSIRAPPLQAKQEPPCPQDSVLDLSVGGVRKSCIQTCTSNVGVEVERERSRHTGGDLGVGPLSLGVLQPVDCSPKLDSKLLSGLASLEFSRQHKWLVDSAGSSAMAGTVHDAALGAGGNIEIVSTSQTAKVIVSVKDAMPAIFCGKLKGLSGVSTKNFSIKRDAGQSGYAALPRVPGDQHGDPNDPLKKMSKNRSIKLKKVSSQEIHILPIKKQRLATFLPRK